LQLIRGVGQTRVELPNEIVERRFRELETVLDRLFEPVRLNAAAEGLYVIDSGNRSGFDMSGYPYFTWEGIVQRDQVLGDQIRRAEVRVSYHQPLDDDVPCVLIAWIAEIFNRGSISHFRRSGEWQLGLTELESSGLIELVAKGLQTASVALDPTG
jgi:hypothetical protein